MTVSGENYPTPAGSPSGGVVRAPQPVASLLESTAAMRRLLRQRIAAVTLAFAGVLVLLYSPMAVWVSQLEESAAVANHVEHVEGLDADVRADFLAAAREYNATRVSGLIIDPFSNTDGADALGVDAAAEDYLSQLRSEDDEVMARVSIPAIDVDLPIYHGAPDQTLRRGAGHLYGSSLPVGGTSTHAVLTGHSGLPQATLFSNLKDLVEGDDIVIEVLGEKLLYRVTETSVVDPTDISLLGVEQGRDLLTLVTCTPIGINTHRLIVQAERVDIPAEEIADGDGALPFPWWAAGLAAALAGWSITVLWIIRADRSRQRENGSGRLVQERITA